MKNMSRGDGFMIPVTAARSREMEDRGFTIAACNKARSDVANLNEKICHLAANAPQSAKDGFAAAYNISAQELCAVTAEVLGEK
ncbi:MAG: hypothetical protein KKH33_06995 [Alphaproteobacteria bacterium]|nr:hypothetical protein [Alphaproteobacteria bacterium]